jgi:hypothetical protein
LAESLVRRRFFNKHHRKMRVTVFGTLPRLGWLLARGALRKKTSS